MSEDTAPRAEIPVFEAGDDWPLELLDCAFERAIQLLDEGSDHVPRHALKLGDTISRRWLARGCAVHLAEIDRIAVRLGRPGAYFFNVSCEWGCTSSAGPSPDGRSAQLRRVLDWPNRGLGRTVIAAHIAGPVAGRAGEWLTLTWPGYTGVLQAVAPGRFAATLNQAPMQQPVGSYPLDWLANRVKVWNQPRLTAAHLLRQVFEQARDFAEARKVLTETPIALPTIYILAGLAPDEACVIERLPDRAHVVDNPACAANTWRAPGWSGRPRGRDNAGRLDLIRAAPHSLDAGFAWLRPPILNGRTRLVFVADAASGAFAAQGYEADGPATTVLQRVIAPRRARPDPSAPGP